MKTLVILFTIALSSFLTFPQAGNSITVKVFNIKNAEGKVNLGLYNKEGFMKKPIVGKSSEIKNGEVVVIFENVPAGNYAVLAYHDVNSNKQLDFMPDGRPAEAYGASNNVINPFGPPQWNDAKFEVAKEPIMLEIKL